MYSFNLFWLADELKPIVWHKMCDSLTHSLTELEIAINTCVAFATKKSDLMIIGTITEHQKRLLPRRIEWLPSWVVSTEKVKVCSLGRMTWIRPLYLDVRKVSCATGYFVYATISSYSWKTFFMFASIPKEEKIVKNQSQSFPKLKKKTGFGKLLAFLAVLVV